MNKRITYFDVFKGILILTVIAEHIIQVSLESVGIFQKHALVNLFTSFNMVAFFVISGYMLHFTMSHTKTPREFVKHIYKRFIQLLIPWFVWGGVYYIVSNDYNLINYARLTFTGEFNAIWFLLCLFVVDIVVSIAVYLGKDKLWLQVLSLFVIEAVLVMIKSYNIPLLFNVYYYFPFFVIGWIINRCSLNKLFESPVIGGLWILIFIMLIPLFTFQKSPLVLRIPLALSGTMALWFCCFNTTKGKIVSILEIIGKYTLAIYCIHVCMMNNIDYLMHQWAIFDFVIISSISIVIAFLCIGISKILSYSPITDILFNGHIQKQP